MQFAATITHAPRRGGGREGGNAGWQECGSGWSSSATGRSEFGLITTMHECLVRGCGGVHSEARVPAR
jgi:hypothetical protein